MKIKHIAAAGGLAFALGFAACGGSTASGPPAPTKHPVPTKPPTVLKLDVQFTGFGTHQTSEFLTLTPWVLVWSCVPPADGGAGAFSVDIATQSDAPAGVDVHPLDTTCGLGNDTHGRVNVGVTGNQELLVSMLTDVNVQWTMKVYIPLPKK